MDEQNVVYMYNGILFNLKEQGNTDTSFKWVNFEDIILSEISQSPKNGIISQKTPKESTDITRNNN